MRTMDAGEHNALEDGTPRRSAGHREAAAALLGILLALPPGWAAAQSRDEFAYWDANGNGDLTCAEAAGRDEGLRLPAYEDDRDGTRIIYEWLERGRSSDTDDDGIGCDSSSNPDGYIPKNQPPTGGCPAGAETWRGLKVCEERARDGYDRDAFGTGYSSLEDEIIAALPSTMKTDGQVYTPYSCIAFEITASGTAATDIEHIVALAEAHDSGIADAQRRSIASDLNNLTIADPRVNRSQKGDRDAAQWQPSRHGAWFAERVVQVKLKYTLSVDPTERDALERLLAGGGAQLNCVRAGFTDDPVVAGTTPVRAAHFSELRSRIHGLRVRQGLTRSPWTGRQLTAGTTPIRATHLSELRAGLEEAYTAAEQAAGFRTEAMTPTQPIRAWHINELRRAVEALETIAQRTQGRAVLRERD